MRFEVLGPLRVLADGREVTPPGRLQQQLLALLLARSERSVPATTLCDELWPNGDSSRSRARLHLLVHRLRSVLDDPNRLEADQGGYHLNVVAADLDSLTFTALAAELSATANDSAAVAAFVRRCLKLWRGTPFENLDSPALDIERGRFEVLRLSALERLYGAELELGRHVQVVSELVDAAREHPLNERMQNLAMTALTRCGRQSDALETFNRTRQTLATELGIGPSSELQSRYEQIIAGDSSDVQSENETRAEGPPSARIPSQLPISPTRLIGRTADLVELDEHISTATIGGGSRLCVIAGTAGVGKTSLAAHWAHDHRNDFTDGTSFAICADSAQKRSPTRWMCSPRSSEPWAATPAPSQTTSANGPPIIEA